MGDIYEVLPFRNTIEQIQIKGEYLRGAFEYSVSEYDVATEYPNGKFLQVSGNANKGKSKLLVPPHFHFIHQFAY